MKTRVLIRINNDSETHFVLKMFKTKATLILVLNNYEERYILLPYLKQIQNVEPILEINNWPQVLRNDLPFHKELFRALNCRDIDYMVDRIKAEMGRNGKYPDFYNSDNMPKIQNYIRNIVGNISDDDVRAIRTAIINFDLS